MEAPAKISKNLESFQLPLSTLVEAPAKISTNLESFQLPLSNSSPLVRTYIRGEKIQIKIIFIVSPDKYLILINGWGIAKYTNMCKIE